MSYARLPWESFIHLASFPLNGIELLGSRRSPLPRRRRRAVKPHIGLFGTQCQCTPAALRRSSSGQRKCGHHLFPTATCTGTTHAKCPDAKPCLGECGRKTTAHESNSPGYCRHCAADVRWVLVR